MSDRDDLRKQVERQAHRMKKAEQDNPNLFSQTIYLGTLGLLFILPMIGGAYLGLWLDEQAAEYSVHWTISGFLLGLLIGVLNVYLFIKE